MWPNYWGMQGSGRLSAVHGRDCPCVSPCCQWCLWAVLKLWSSGMSAKTGEGSGSGCQVADRMDKDVPHPPPLQPAGAQAPALAAAFSRRCGCWEWLKVRPITSHLGQCLCLPIDNKFCVKTAAQVCWRKCWVIFFCLSKPPG